MSHRAHRMHRNTLGAYASTDFSDRERAILRALRSSSVPLTDRDIAFRLGLSDMNAVRPRITELLEDHVLVECCDVRCAVTGKTVRTVALAVAVQESIA